MSNEGQPTPLMCPEHPQRELEFFNPQAKILVCSLCCATGNSVGQRCQDIPTALGDHHAKFSQVKEVSDARVAELEKLGSHLKQQMSVVDLREADTVRRIKQETERLVTLLRRREEELVKLVSDDTEVQRSALETTTTAVDDAIASITTDSVLFQDASQPGGVRLNALYATERNLRHTSLFGLPDTSQYSVSSRAVVPEAHLSLSRTLHAMHAPPGVTIAMSERQLSASGGEGSGRSGSLGQHAADGAASGDVQTSMLSHSNIECPSGLIHFLATGGGSRDFVNCVSSGLMGVSLRDAVPLVGDPQVLLDERSALSGHVPAGTFRSKASKSGRIVFDFIDRKVQVTSYLLQHGHEEEHAALRSWTLLGSNDGEEWTTIDAKKNDTTLTGPYTSAAFRVASTLMDGRSDSDVLDFASRLDSPDSKKKSTSAAAAATTIPAWRMLALQIAGPNAAGLYQIELARVEFYGRLLS